MTGYLCYWFITVWFLFKKSGVFFLYYERAGKIYIVWPSPLSRNKSLNVCVKDQALLFLGIRCFTEVELQVLDLTSIFTTRQPITGIVLPASLLHSISKPESWSHQVSQCTMNSRSPCLFTVHTLEPWMLWLYFHFICTLFVLYFHWFCSYFYILTELTNHVCEPKQWHRHTFCLFSTLF